MVDFVIVGFPKCGTTALMRMLGKIDGVVIDLWNGALEEAPFYSSEEGIRQLKTMKSQAAGVRGHKYASYIYNESALRRIRDDNPNPLFIVCVRDPVRSLISWREMHRQIAIAASPPSHFVNKDSSVNAFYRTASLDEYYQVFARKRLKYAEYIQNMYAVLERPRMMIVAQEYLARFAGDVVKTFRRAVNHEDDSHLVLEQPAHVGFADRVDVFEARPELIAELRENMQQLTALCAELASHRNVQLLVSTDQGRCT